MRYCALLLFMFLYSTDLITGASSCGNILIPYPFGIGNGCYLNEWFEVQCNDSISGNHVPYLPKINKEVVSINLPTPQDGNISVRYGELHIKTKITSTGCSSNSSNNRNGRIVVGEVLDFTGSPFTIGRSNVLMAVGCNNKAALTNFDPLLVGCTSSCDPRKKRDQLVCSGYKCCQLDSPFDMIGGGIKVVGVSIEDIRNQTQTCRVAFLTVEFRRYPRVYPSEILTDPRWFHNRKYVTLELQWIIPNTNLSFIHSLSCEDRFLDYGNKSDKTCLCRQAISASLNESVGTSCQCSRGYKGNPYRPDGCTDIDECQKERGSRCGKYETCVNTQGSYHCVNKWIKIIKISIVVDENKLEEFINEVVILSQINHRHIVKLLGCCLETEVPLLVYEFIPNGNLFEHLHDDSDDYTMVIWEVRLRIALDIAEALSYLHSAAASPIYHRDIKTTNIMLDEKHRGKVSDFGTSRSVTIDQTHLTTVVSGTFGYLDPEYYQSSQFTDKSDVYSFGVVLVELITGQKPIRTQENESLATYFLFAMKDKNLFNIIDSRIRDDCNLEQVIATARLAKRCLNPSRKRRPNMRAVAMELERIRSPNGNSQSHLQIVEEDEDEVDVEINIGLQSFDIVGVTAPSILQDNDNSTSCSDAEPLLPRQTW